MSNVIDCCNDWTIECQDVCFGDPIADTLNIQLLTNRQTKTCALFDGWWRNPNIGATALRPSENQAVTDVRNNLENALNDLVSDGLITTYDVTVTAEGPGVYCFQVTAQGDLGECNLITVGTVTGLNWIWDGFSNRT